MRWTAPMVLSLFAACEPGSAPIDAVDRALVRDSIVGGVPAPDDDTVYMLFLRGDNGARSRCSATLIAPRTLLTAAHCVDPRILGATSLSIIASNADSEALVDSGVNTVDVTETRMHPTWNPATLDGDLALALLATPQEQLAPKPWNGVDLAGKTGQPVRALGYGTQGFGIGSGTRREVDLTMRQLSSTLISLGNQVDKGVCHGDSGGPTFHRFPDGVERVVGVHSFTRTEECTDGADTRVDVHEMFILQWLADKENECLANGVCAVGTCAAPDPDCVAQGDACRSQFDCQGRKCVTDAQHPATYCSKTCATDVDCGAGFTCDTTRRVCQFVQLPTVRPGEACTPGAEFCLDGTVCTGRDAASARCSRTCVMTSDCPNPQRCQPGFEGTRVCVDAPPVLLPLARLEGPRATGCSTGLGLLPFLGLLLLRRRM